MTYMYIYIFTKLVSIYIEREKNELVEEKVITVILVCTSYYWFSSLSFLFFSDFHTEKKDIYFEKKCYINIRV